MQKKNGRADLRIRTVASLVTIVPPRLFQSVTCIAGRIYALIASIRIVAHLASFAIVRVQLALVYVFKKYKRMKSIDLLPSHRFRLSL